MTVKEIMQVTTAMRYSIIKTTEDLDYFSSMELDLPCSVSDIGAAMELQRDYNDCKVWSVTPIAKDRLQIMCYR